MIMAMVMMMMRVLMVMMIGVEMIRRGLSREISHCAAPTNSGESAQS